MSIAGHLSLYSGKSSSSVSIWALKVEVVVEAVICSDGNHKQNWSLVIGACNGCAAHTLRGYFKSFQRACRVHADNECEWLFNVTFNVT